MFNLIRKLLRSAESECYLTNIRMGGKYELYNEKWDCEVFGPDGYLTDFAKVSDLSGWEGYDVYSFRGKAHGSDQLARIISRLNTSKSNIYFHGRKVSLAALDVEAVDCRGFISIPIILNVWIKKED